MSHRVTVPRLSENPREISAHRRFALRNVTLGDLAVPGATVDAWLDVSHREHWAARLWVPIAHPPLAGVLAGTAAGGQWVSGSVLIGDLAAAVHRGREQLVEFHGDGPLTVDDAPDGVTTAAPRSAR